MSSESNASKARRVENILNEMASSDPLHAPVIMGLTILLVTRARLAEELPLPSFHQLLEKDRARFLQGAPLIPRSRMPIDGKVMSACAAQLAPVLAKTFPVVGQQIVALHEAFTVGQMRLVPRLKRYLEKGRLPEKATLAGVGSTPEAAGLYLEQLVKVLAEAVSARVVSTVDLEGWTRGYCPVCGSQPEVSYLEGKEGRRRLSCSLCQTSWRYTRVACPNCETNDHDKIELIYVDGKPQERVEACHECNRYVLGVDRRELAREVMPALEPLGLLHLDILAQEKGFTPSSGEPAVTG